MNQPDITRQFGFAVRRLREERGFTQDQLAGAAKLHRTYISDIERGRRNPSLGSIHRISGALGVSLQRLFE